MTKAVSIQEARRLIAAAASWKPGKAPPLPRLPDDGAALRQPRTGHEDAEQEALAAWLDRVLGEHAWCHVPNGGKRSAKTASAMKRAGVKAGVADVLIFTRCPAYPQARGVALELKRQKGGHVSDAQKAWLRAREVDGWLCRVCEGCADAVAWLRALGWTDAGDIANEVF